jgi:hypothetical protein
MATINSIQFYLSRTSNRTGFYLNCEVRDIGLYTDDPGADAVLGTATPILVDTIPTTGSQTWVTFTFTSPVTINDTGFFSFKLWSNTSNYNVSGVQIYNSDDWVDANTGSPFDGKERGYRYDNAGAGSWTSGINVAYIVNCTDNDGNSAQTPNASSTTLGEYGDATDAGTGIRSNIILTPPEKAINPTPADSATGIDFSGFETTWEDGGGADTFDVYLGPVGSLTKVSTAQAGVSYTTDAAEIITLFGVHPTPEDIFWRIDSTNNAGTTTGDTWSFRAMPSINKVRLGSDGSFILAMMNQGIATSANLGSTWTTTLPDTNDQTNWTNGDCSNDGTYLIVSDSNGNIYRSANGGSSWSLITPAGGDTVAVNDISFDEAGAFVVLALTNSTNSAESLWISTDFGVSWTTYNPGNLGATWTSCSTANGGQTILVGRSGKLYSSFDSGVTWSPQSPSSGTNAWTCLDISRDGTIAFVADGGTANKVYRTSDNVSSTPEITETSLTSYARTLIDDTTAENARNTLELGTGDSVEFSDLTLGSPLTVANGGIGTTTLTDHGILLGSGTNAITPLGVATNGQLPIGSTGTDPVLAVITGSKGLTVTNGAGTIALATNSVLEDLDTLGAVSSDGEFIVGTGAGVFAYESGNTARTSLGLGTGDSPTFLGLTVTNAAVLGSDSALFQPNADNAAFLQIKDAAGTSVMAVDTIDERVVVGGNSTAYGKFTVGVGEALSTGADVANYGMVVFGAGAAYYVARDTTNDIEFIFGTSAISSYGFIQMETNHPLVIRDINTTSAIIVDTTSRVGIYESSPDTLIHMSGTQPYFTLQNTTHEDIDDGRESKFLFKGEQSGGEETTLAEIRTSHDGATDDQKGKIEIYTNGGSDGDSPTLAFTVDSDQVTTFSGSVVTSSSLTANGRFTTNELVRCNGPVGSNNIIEITNNLGTGRGLNINQTSNTVQYAIGFSTGRYGAYFVSQSNSTHALLNCLGNGGTSRFLVNANGDIYLGNSGSSHVAVDATTGDLVFVGSSSGLPFAQIYEEDGSSTLTLAAQDTFYQVTAFTANGESNNATPDHTNDHITIVKAGKYLATIDISFSQTSAVSIEYDFHLQANNGVKDFGYVSAHRDTSGNQVVGNCGCTGIVDLAVNDTVELWVERLSGGATSRTITIPQCSITLTQIGGT